ncbi:thiolase-like protein [Coniochaeta ligniaria NRRL 30616]|uniref:Thiolase-like protein n=1 Tax=Coniochaeta ligniaria NRRL 30616 TaxID=1408157 RepID=A0A1J7IAV3_9PEZI|nr:thiolase-like protein [Coniochaeta ligniaria NRRL 30616]
MAPPSFPQELGLSIIGLGTQYPPYTLAPSSVETLSARFYPSTPSMQKVLAINRFTGIDTRSSIGTPDHPLVNQSRAPTIAELHNTFMTDGLPLAVSAARKALLEAGVPPEAVTHVVSTTCTDSANPGYDHYVAKELGLRPDVQRVLLHGVGCSGGLAALRTAANLALGHGARGKSARVLVLAAEVSTTMVRSELDSVDELQETRIGVALFSDCASAVVLANGIGEAKPPVYELLGWQNRIIPDTEADLGFDVHPCGWKVVLSPRVPKLAQGVVLPTYEALIGDLPPLPERYGKPADFDWAMHPGGATILTGAEKALGISAEHMRASYDTYINHGNSSSATVFSVLDRLRSKEMDALAPGGVVKEYVVGCAFGPGITVEMCMLKRNLGTRGISGLQTPPETESEGSSRSDDGEEDAVVPQTERIREGDAFISEALAGVELD